MLNAMDAISPVDRDALCRALTAARQENGRSWLVCEFGVELLTALPKRISISFGPIIYNPGLIVGTEHRG